MKKTTMIWNCILLMSILSVYAESVEEFEEKYNKVGAAFEKGSFFPGRIIIAFSPTITREKVEELLFEYGLIIFSEEKCVTESTAGPGEPVWEKKTCKIEEGWIESLKTATVAVPEGTEKETALAIVAQSEILMVEPQYIAELAITSKPEAAQETIQEQQNEIKETQLNIFQRFFAWSASFF